MVNTWPFPSKNTKLGTLATPNFSANLNRLTSSSNGIGLYHIYGDETTYGEGYNMQQIPKREQDLYGKITALMSESHVFHTPESIRDGLRKGYLKTKHPYKAGPFYFMLPINTQPKIIKNLNLITLPGQDDLKNKSKLDYEQIKEFEKIINKYEKIVIKAGGGSIKFSRELKTFSENLKLPVVLAPGSLGILPDDHENNMHVGGSKGSISGNYAMQNAELLISIGSRSVCQSDCSGIGYPNAKEVININADLADMMHYNNTLGLNGDIGTILNQLNTELNTKNIKSNSKNNWIEECKVQKRKWFDFKKRIYENEKLKDEAFGKVILTQPAAIKYAVDFSNENKCVKFFDAGDVQANGFQIAEDMRPDDTFTETGASYMGFSTSAILASAIADNPRYPISFTGDGSFMMNPQALIDAVYFGLKGMIIIFDNNSLSITLNLNIFFCIINMNCYLLIITNMVKLFTSIVSVE